MIHLTSISFQSKICSVCNCNNAGNKKRAKILLVGSLHRVSNNIKHSCMSIFWLDDFYDGRYPLTSISPASIHEPYMW